MEKSEKYRCDISEEKWVEEEEQKCEFGSTDFDERRVCLENLNREAVKRSRYCKES
jgi:hypothetical protein